MTGQTQGQSGDSGSPTFALVNGTLTLVGVHSAIGTVLPNPNPATFDNFLAWPSILLQVSDVTVASGQSVTLYVSSIPEPAAVSAVLGISALVVTAGCRKKRPVTKTGTPNRTT